MSSSRFRKTTQFIVRLWGVGGGVCRLSGNECVRCFLFKSFFRSTLHQFDCATCWFCFRLCDTIPQSSALALKHPLPTHAQSQCFPQTPGYIVVCLDFLRFTFIFCSWNSSSLFLRFFFFFLFPRNNIVKTHQSIGGLTLFGPIKLSPAPAGSFHWTSWSASAWAAEPGLLVSLKGLQREVEVLEWCSRNYGVTKNGQ